MKYYECSQFGEIVFLKYKKISHKKLKRDEYDSNKVIFCFEESEKREELTNKFYNHKGKIEDALAFIDEIRHVKSLIHGFLNK